MLDIPGSWTKNGLAHEVPLPALAIAELPPRREMKGPISRSAMFRKRADEGFSGWSRCMKRLNKRLAGLAREFLPAPALRDAA